MDYGYSQMMSTINAVDQPLIIVDGHGDTHFGYFLAFGHELGPHVRVKWGDNAINDVRHDYSDIFLYRPSTVTKDAVAQEGNRHLETMIPGLLWRLTWN